MKANWPKVLRQRVPDVAVEPTETYIFAGVYSFGRGVFRAQVRHGSEFAYQCLTRLRKGEFVYPKLMAWEGAFGIVPVECDGCHVSPEFPVFEIDTERLAPSFLGFYFRIPRVWESMAGRSTGTNVRRRRLHPGNFLRREIPLPPLAEQGRVVARIEELAVQIHQARVLHRQADADVNTFMAAAENSVWLDSPRLPSRRLQELTSLLARGRQSEQGESDHYLIKTQHVQLGRYLPTTLKLSDHAAARVRNEALVGAGDILVACSAAGCLGRVARYDESGKKVSTDTHVAIARPDATIIDPDYLYAYLRSAPGQFQLRSRERGDWRREKVGFRLTELNLRDLQDVPIPLPTREEQGRIVKYLEFLRAQVDRTRLLQAQTTAELGALLPTILDRAFAGEL